MKRDEPRIFVLVVVASMCLPSSARADLGAAKSFAVLSSGGNVSLKNRDRISKVPIPGAVSCPGAAGCRSDVGGKTVLMGRGNGAVPDQINANVIASASASQGLNCAGAAPGSTAICLGNNSAVTGACVTAGGAVSKSGDCGGGTDTSGTNSDVTTLLPNAGPDAADFSAFLIALPATQSPSAIHLGTGGVAKITLAAGLNVIRVPSVVTGARATITINGDSNAMAVINVLGGLLSLGNVNRTSRRDHTRARDL